MAALTPVSVSRSGGDISTLTAASASDTFTAGPNTYLRVKNASGSPVTVTLTPATGGGPFGTTIAPVTFSVPATTGDVLRGPYPQYPYGDVNGNVTVTYSATTSVTVQAITVSG